MPQAIDYFLPYQLEWINDPSPLSIAEKSRRIGWTYAESYRAVQDRVAADEAGKKRDLFYSSADLTAAREFSEYCHNWCRVFNTVADQAEGEETVAIEDEAGKVIDERKIFTLRLTFRKGSKIVIGSSNPLFFRSKGGDADGDEFAFHREGRELFKAMHATALFWGYRLRLWSTHNGEGSYFNTQVKAARSGQLKARVHRVTILDAVEQGLVEKIKGLKSRDDNARQEWLDELKGTCPDEGTWQEEYLCNPQSEANALLSYELIRGCERTAEELTVVEDPRELKFNGAWYAGFDVGRQRDLSVFWGLGKVGDVWETRVLKRFTRTPYDVQEGYLNLLMAQGCKRICIDATGIGNMLAERAVQRYGKWRAEAVMFTAQVKAELAMPLVRLFEDKLVRIPSEPGIRESLHKVRKIVTAAGNVRFDAVHDETGHADEFWALALAYHAADDLKMPRIPSQAVKPVGW